MANIMRLGGFGALIMIQTCIIICVLIACSSLETSSTTTPLSSSQLYTFAQPQSFLQLQPDWALPAIREVTFQFRTDRPHGLLLYHGSTADTSDFPFYELYVMLENGQIKIIHVFKNDGDDETFVIGKGLNRDKWHNVTLRINPGAAHLSIRVDEKELTISLPSLSSSPSYNLVDNIPDTVMYFGGLDPNNYAINQKYNYVRFIGCLGNIMFSQSGNPLIPTEVILANQVEDNYVDLCKKSKSCLYNGKCINHYTHTSCDCFGTKHEDSMCFRSEITTVTLRGYSYITYRVYDWRDRVHSEFTRLSFSFRTYFKNSVLAYASGKHPNRNYLAVSLYDGQLYFEIDFGDGPLNQTIGYTLNDESWHTFTVQHRGRNISLSLDSRWTANLEATGTHHHLHLDPEIYIGGAPESAQGLLSHEKFIGCLHTAYFNDKNIIYALYNDDSSARYYGIFSVEYGCDSINVIPITFPLPESKLVLEMPSTRHLDLSLEFKTSQKNCVLASGRIKTEKGIGNWEVQLHNGIATFLINSGATSREEKRLVDQSSGKGLADDTWHHIGAIFDNDEIQLKVDYRYKSSLKFIGSFEFQKEIIVTTSAIDEGRGFIGCIRDIYLAGKWLDPRTVVDTPQVSGKVSLDDCQLVNLCNNPHACENGGRCFIHNGETYCHCNGTGYTGRTCHFSQYKRTCEELYLVGYRTKGIYTIDIDRNGPLPPAHVHCDMGDDGGPIATKVENNMPPEMVVRKVGMSSFYVDITYREFTPTMLQSLVKHSKSCFQNIKYECFKTPLGLRTYTWMTSSGSNDYITSFGNPAEGCNCAESKSCANSSILCNCDAADIRWRVDEGKYTKPEHLGITRVYILQPKNLEPAAEARLTLGPLECVETDTQKYVITFKTPNSYIEVPGWRRGDIAFSFRTSNNQAVLIYQASIHTSHGYLRVLLINDYELVFQFTLNEQPISRVVKSSRKLNSGEWQQVWVDHDRYHMRFTVNLNSEMIDFGEAHGVGPFEGPLYVGGVPENVAGDSAIKEGFIGCFRGLVINDAVVDLYKFMTRSESAIVLGCQPSCASNPCKNGATCHEYWGSYMCECVNPYAHSGKNCELNVNLNGMTFTTPQSYYHLTQEGSVSHPVLEKSILLNFRTYEKAGLLLYAFDNLNNFVQLHFKDKKIFFTFNSARTLYQIYVDAPDISKGFPIQIKVDRQLQRTTLSVYDKSISINVTMKFVDKYLREPWNENGELETVFPPRGAYRTIDHSEMFIGYVGSGTTTSFVDHGFVGCIQGLKVGDEIFDLESAARSDSDSENELEEPTMSAITGEISGIVKPGCNMMCDEQPCQNHGLCIEHWLENTTSCDCTLTSYTGEICQKDIGGNFDGKSVLIYSFEGELVEAEDVAIRFAFSTDDASGLAQVLLLVKFTQSKYVLVCIDGEHSLFVEEYTNNTVVRHLAKTNNTWSDGNRHWIYFARNAPETTFVVDGMPYVPFIQMIDQVSPLIEKPDNNIYVAGFPQKADTLEQYRNFKGCISNVIVEALGQMVMPLETAFGYLKGALRKVTVHGSVNERKCSSFAQLSQLMATLPSVSKTEIHGQEWFKEPPILVPYKSVFAGMTATSLEAISKTSNRVATVLGVLLLIVVMCLLFYIYRIQRRYKREKMGEEYEMYKGKRRTPSGNKVVSFSEEDREGDVSDVQPLTWVPMPPTPGYIAPPPAPDFKRNSIKPLLPNDTTVNMRPKAQDGNSMELAPMRTSSQELEWDPAGAQLVSTMLDDMSESSEAGERESEDLGPLPNLKSQVAPLATASEVTINRLSQTFA